MTGAKTDMLHKRLESGGVPQEACEKYVHTLRAFLSARMTKIQFENEMKSILPVDKVHLHNSIIHDLLNRALRKRDGIADLPLLAPLKDKRQPVARRAPPVKSPLIKSEPVKPALPVLAGTKRALNDTRPPEPRKPDASQFEPIPPPPSKRLKPRPAIVKPSAEVEKPAKVAKPKAIIPEKPSPVVKRRKPTDRHPNLPPPSPSPSTSAQPLAPPKLLPVVSPEIETYDGLPFMPSKPGYVMDIELYAKLKDRMRLLTEHIGLGVKDDAIALVVQAIEQHIKTLLESAVLLRRRRCGTAKTVDVGRIKPREYGTGSHLLCAPVRPFDLHQSARKNGELFADESVVNLERLSMLL